MAFFPRWRLILFVLILSGGQIMAASKREQRAYDSAVAIFNTEMWNRAALALEQFQKKYPDSTNMPLVVLMEAQAEYKQGNFKSAATKLAAAQSQAGKLADQYANWIGEAQFANSNLLDAAETFVSLAHTFPASPLRLPAVVKAAAAFAQLDRWPDVEKILEETNGVFQTALKMDAGNELISRGRLFLAQAKFEQKDYRGAAAVLDELAAQPLAPELDWQREHWVYRLDIAGDDWAFALTDTTNLIQIAKLQKNPAVRAESFALQAEALEKLDHPNQAAAVYAENLKTNAPTPWQRQAVLKIAQIALAQNRFSDAEKNLADFIEQFSNAPAADIALLSLGELHLQEFAAQPGTLNHFIVAQASFDRLLNSFTNNGLAGKVYLDRGWANWLAGKVPESLADFEMAVRELPPSEDLAVAKFKLADAEFAQKNFFGARQNYQSVLDDFTNFPEVKKELSARALYQILRASIELNDEPAATAAEEKILSEHATEALAQSSALLLGENTIDPIAARTVLEKFQWQFPHSPLLGQVDLAVARTFEQEQNWEAAITNYSNWLTNYPGSSLRAQAQYSLAWANYQAGHETNALGQFKDFIVQFPANALAPQAQWWIADYYFRSSDQLGTGNFIVAETNYENIFQNPAWQDSPLVYPAQLMAGRAAMGRLGFSDAVSYFMRLINLSLNDTNCPPDIGSQARLACGAAFMQMASPDTNNPVANFQSATNVLGPLTMTTNEFAVSAWGEIGKCDLQLSDFSSATNAFAQVFNTNSPADISLRSEAQIGFGLALEKMASPNTNQNDVLNLALDNYATVFFRENLRDDEVADSFWIKKAGLQMLPLIYLLEPAKREIFIAEMEKTFPQMTAALEKLRLPAPEKS